MRYRVPLLAAGWQFVTWVRRGGAAWLCLPMLPILLHACAGEEFVPVEATCPDLLLVAEASRVVAHTDQGDPAGHVASIGGLGWSCTFLPESHRTQFTAHLEIMVTTTPRDVPQDVSFPLFVALEDREGRIISKKVVDSAVRIPPGSAEIVYSQTIGQEFGYARMTDVAAHTIYTGFQIRSEDLARSRTEE
ncbi:MAG: hypothetical protein OXU19_05270 [bacterium]|nr:hypothetical protein [bacterium]